MFYLCVSAWVWNRKPFTLHNYKLVTTNERCRITMIPSDCISLVMRRLRSFENTNRSCYCCNMRLYPTQMGLEWFRHYRWTHNSPARMKPRIVQCGVLRKCLFLQVETLCTDEIQVSGPTMSSFFVFCRLDQEISQPLILPLLVNIGDTLW